MQTSGTFNILIQMPSSGGGNKTPTPANPAQVNTPISPDPVRGSEDKSSNTVAISAVTNVAINMAKQAANAAISNIGLATGDSYMQARVQKVTSEVTDAASFIGALVTGNYIGAAVMLGSKAISIGSEAYRIEKEREIANYKAEQYARKLGYVNARG